MEIKLKLSNEDIDRILMVNGYVCERVLMWYPKHPFDANMAFELNELGCYYVKMAYPKENCCPWRHEEKPLIENYKEFEYENVVNNLINKLMFSKLL